MTSLFSLHPVPPMSLFVTFFVKLCPYFFNPLSLFFSFFVKFHLPFLNPLSLFITFLVKLCPHFFNPMSLFVSFFVKFCNIFPKFLSFFVTFFCDALSLLLQVTYFLNGLVFALNKDKWMLSGIWVRFTVKSYVSTIRRLIDNFH